MTNNPLNNTRVRSNLILISIYDVCTVIAKIIDMDSKYSLFSMLLS